MPDARQPLTGSNFRVDLGDDRQRMPESGFAEVIFPPFAVSPDPAEPARLLLRRAATGATDLYNWWNAARKDISGPARIVTVELLSGDLKRAEMRWRFFKARPVSLDYSPLDANQPAIVTETLVLTFERVEIG